MNNLLLPIFPELFVLAMSLVILMIGVFSKHGAPRVSFYLSQITLLLAAFFVLHVFVLCGRQSTFALHHMFVLDSLSVSLKILVLIAMVLTLGYSDSYNKINCIPANEFYVLSLLSTLGMMILVSSTNFLTLFLGLELMSLPIYAMAALMRSKDRCIEAAMKYFIIGAVASSMLLYGFSLLFGATHSLDLQTVSTAIAETPLTQNLILLFALVFVIAGLAFKLGAAPFHSWVPDVYDGAPNSVTLLISAAPKLAAFGLFVRVLMYGVPSLHVQWDHVLIALGLLSIAIGNLVAIVQTNIKRLLAYSSIAHIGFIMLGLGCGTVRGDGAAFFYMVTYALTSLGAFGVITLLSRTDFDANELSDFAGLSQTQPWLAFMMLLMMFSLAGIPPLVGFMAKLGILEALISAHSVWLAVVAIIFSIIGVYYYIRVVKVMYFEESHRSEKVNCSPSVTLVMSMNGLMVLLLGIFPSQLFILCHSVF